MLVNRFKMREDILSFNLGGMGCSAGVIAIGLAQRLLKTEPEKYALVVSTENITQVTFLLSQPALGLSMHRCFYNSQRLLKTEPEKYALVVSIENITQVIILAGPRLMQASGLYILRSFTEVRVG